jgi:hypothetical protein
VAEGTTAAGTHWAIRAGGTPRECLTLMDIVMPDGRRTGGGGHGGPALPPGGLLSYSVHRTSAPATHYLVARVHPRVERLRLQFAGARAPERDVRPVGNSPDLGVTFAAELMPTDVELVGISAWDGADHRLQQHHDRHHGAFFRHTHPDDAPPDPPQSNR